MTKTEQHLGDLTLTRRPLNRDDEHEETRLRVEARRKILAPHKFTTSPRQLTWEEPWREVNEAEDEVSRTCRASLVNVALDGDSDGVGRYSVLWPMIELARANHDAAECVMRAREKYERVDDEGKEVRVSQASEQNCRFFRWIDPEEDLVVLRGPEAEAEETFPFFAQHCIAPRRMFRGNDDEDRIRGVILVSSARGLAAWGFGHAMRKSPSPQNICPPLVGLKHVAFIFREEFEVGGIPGYAERLGLNSFDFGDFKGFNVYLLDLSITLRPGKTPPPGTPSFAGHQATFYQVESLYEDDRNPWNINRYCNREITWDHTTWHSPSAVDRNAPPVFRCALMLAESSYSNFGRLQVLACVPHIKATGEERVGWFWGGWCSMIGL